MRLFWVLIALLTLSAVFVYSRGSGWLGHELSGVLEGLWYQKVISVSGLKTIQEYEVMEVLPAEKSVGWWNSNLNLIADELRKDPRVKRAVVGRCKGEIVAIYCFEVRVEEREPSFVTEFGGERWVVGDDGGFISPITGLATFNHLPVVEGVGGDVQTSQFISGRIASAIKDVSLILGKRITKLRIDKNRELQILFAELPFQAVFAFQGFDEITIADQARRLLALLEAKRGQWDSIKEVDLAFDKIAVVKYQETKSDKAVSKTRAKKKA